CVNHVKALQKSDPQLFSELDQQMQESVKICMQALSQENQQQGLALLVEGLGLGQDCFEKWGLVPKEVNDAISKLKESGAIQCKLTGSGGGGYLLSLWKEKPPAEIEKNLLVLF